MCKCLLFCCYACCSNPKKGLATEIVEDTLNNIQKALNEHFAPITLTETCDNMVGENKIYRPEILNDQLKSDLEKKVYEGLSLCERTVRPFSITLKEQMQISFQLSHHIILKMLDMSEKFPKSDFADDLLGYKSIDYSKDYKAAIENFINDITTFGKCKVNIKTTKSGEHRSLNERIAKKITCLLESSDMNIVDATSQAIQYVRSKTNKVIDNNPAGAPTCNDMSRV